MTNEKTKLELYIEEEKIAFLYNSNIYYVTKKNSNLDEESLFNFFNNNDLKDYKFEITSNNSNIVSYLEQINLLFESLIKDFYE